MITMFKEFDLQTLRHVPQFAHYFRYPLRHRDFHEVRERGRLLGRMAATALRATDARGQGRPVGGFQRAGGGDLHPGACADAARRKVIDHGDAASTGYKS